MPRDVRHKTTYPFSVGTGRQPRAGRPGPVGVPHRSRQLRPPRADYSPADLSQEQIRRRPVLGGLISEYQRAA